MLNKMQCHWLQYFFRSSWVAVKMCSSISQQPKMNWKKDGKFSINPFRIVSFNEWQFISVTGRHIWITLKGEFVYHDEHDTSQHVLPDLGPCLWTQHPVLASEAAFSLVILNPHLKWLLKCRRYYPKYLADVQNNCFSYFIWVLLFL
jgi:hypothetical protein